MLRIDTLSAFYGEAQVLREVSLDVAAGEVVTLVGRNGAGKSTLLRCVMGLHPGQRGTIELDGRDISRLPAGRTVAFTVPGMADYISRHVLD